MKSFSVIKVLFFAILVGLISQLDCDILLYLMPDPKTGESPFLNKTIWIVGASSGIGSQLAIDLCKQGANLILSGRRESRLLEVVDSCKKIENLQNIPTIQVLDVTSNDMIDDVYNNIMNDFAKIDILVLNAGQSQRNVAMETSIEDTQSLFNTNFFSFVKLATTVIPSMSKGSQVVVTSSVSGRIGTPGGSSYSATKFALQGYFDAVRSEISSNGIDILTVLPGPVESEISTKAKRGKNIPEGEEGKKMATKRCTQLMVRAMSYPKYFDEIWVSSNPVLATLNLYHYFPFIGRQLFKNLVGPKRIETMRTGGNVFDAGSLFGLKSGKK